MKKTGLRQIIFLLVATCLFAFLMPMTAFANNSATECSNYQQVLVNPRLTYIAETQTDLAIKNGVAKVDCWVKGDVLTATKTKVIAELQLKSGNSWMAYGTWTTTQNDYEAYVYKTKAVTEGNTYRVKATFTVWEGSQSETIIVFSDEVTA